MWNKSLLQSFIDYGTNYLRRHVATVEMQPISTCFRKYLSVDDI